MTLPLGTLPVWGYEGPWAGATESRDLQRPSEKTDLCQWCSLHPSPARDPLPRLGGRHGLTLLSARGRGRNEDPLLDAGNLLGSPQGASGSEESSSFLTKGVFKVSFRLQSSE